MKVPLHRPRMEREEPFMKSADKCQKIRNDFVTVVNALIHHKDKKSHLSQRGGSLERGESIHE